MSHCPSTFPSIRGCPTINNLLSTAIPTTTLLPTDQFLLIRDTQLYKVPLSILTVYINSATLVLPIPIIPIGAVPGAGGELLGLDSSSSGSSSIYVGLGGDPPDSAPNTNNNSSMISPMEITDFTLLLDPVNATTSVSNISGTNATSLSLPSPETPSYLKISVVNNSISNTGVIIIQNIKLTDSYNIVHNLGDLTVSANDIDELYFSIPNVTTSKLSGDVTMSNGVDSDSRISYVYYK